MKTPQDILFELVDKIIEDVGSTMAPEEFRLATDRALQIMDRAIDRQRGPYFDKHGNRVNEDGSLWNLDGKLAARNGND